MKTISRSKPILFAIKLGIMLSFIISQLLFQKPAKASHVGTEFYCGTYRSFWGSSPATMSTYKRRRVTLRTWSDRDDCEYFSDMLNYLANRGELVTIVVGKYRGRNAICGYSYFTPNWVLDCSWAQTVFIYRDDADMRGVVYRLALLPGEPNNGSRHSSARYRSSQNGQMLGIDVQGWLEAAYESQY